MVKKPAAFALPQENTVCVCAQSLCHVQLFATPWTVAHQTPPSTGFSRQEYWMGCHFLLQGIFPTQRSNPLSPALVRGFLTVEPPGKPVTPSGVHYSVYHALQVLPQTGISQSSRPHWEEGSAILPALQMGKLSPRQENQWFTCHTQLMTGREVQTQLPEYKPRLLSKPTISILW